MGMKVAHIIPGIAARQGGPSIALVKHALELRKHGVETTIFTTDLAGPASKRPAVRVHPSDLPHGAEELDIRIFEVKTPTRLAYSPALRRALDREASQFDVFHVHALYLYPTYAAASVARRRRIPYVLSPHGALDPALRGRSRALKRLSDALWQERAMNNAAAVHYTTPAEARLAADVGISAPSVIVPNAVDPWGKPSSQRARDFRKRYLHGAQGPILLILGRISHKKGVDILIRSLSALAPSSPDMRLVVAGPDDESLCAELLELARRERVSDRVVFTGMLREEERLAAFSAASVFALPSKTENFGNVVVEAMAAGVPVVVSPHVNLAEDLVRERAAVVCDRDAEAVATAVQRLLHDDEHREEKIRRGYRFAHALAADAVIPRMAAMYRTSANKDVPSVNRIAVTQNFCRRSRSR
jgi:glycosyltransferase involved in cell wall biosynthesis